MLHGLITEKRLCPRKLLLPKGNCWQIRNILLLLRTKLTRFKNSCSVLHIRVLRDHHRWDHITYPLFDSPSIMSVLIGSSVLWVLCLVLPYEPGCWLWKIYRAITCGDGKGSRCVQFISFSLKVVRSCCWLGMKIDRSLYVLLFVLFLWRLIVIWLQRAIFSPWARRGSW